MRIVSLLPSTTEILFEIGAGDDVVGVTFECDYPVEARTRQIVSNSAMSHGLTPKEIDEFVAAALRRGEDLYHLEADALIDLDADLVVTQDLCAVCAIDVSIVDDALTYLGCRAEVLTIDPYTIGDVLDSVLLLGERTGHLPEASRLVDSLNARLDAVRSAVAGRPKPRVLVLEWTDPPYAPGHWIPEMVELAGGIPVLGTTGEKSFRMSWEQAEEAAPDVVICAPCGFDLDAASELAGQVVDRFGDTPVWAVDANASFARSGPRVVDGIEDLASIFHPDAVLRPDAAVRRVHATQHVRGMQSTGHEEWSTRLEALRSELDYAAAFQAAGESYSEVDDDGNLVIRPALD